MVVLRLPCRDQLWLCWGYPAGISCVCVEVTLRLPCRDWLYCRPIPERELVEAYIKAYYLPDSQLEAWVLEHKVRSVCVCVCV